MRVEKVVQRIRPHLPVGGGVCVYKTVFCKIGRFHSRPPNPLGWGAGMSEAEGSLPLPTCYSTPSHQDGFGDPPTKMEQVWWRGEKRSFWGALGLVS